MRSWCFERESGTERLDQAFAAYRAALDPDRALTWPNQASSRTPTPPRAPLAVGCPRLSGGEPTPQNLVLGFQGLDVGFEDVQKRHPLTRTSSPLSAPPPRKTRFGSPLVLSHVHWVEPQLVAEITYLTCTEDGLLRHTDYVGLRSDKPAQEVRQEAPRGD
jgi:hypothetical protein